MALLLKSSTLISQLYTDSDDLKDAVITTTGRTFVVKNDTYKYFEFYKIAPLSLNKVDLADEITMCPNPTNSQLNIKIGNISISKIQLFNVNGRMVLETKIANQKSEINKDVSKLAKGAYFVIIFDNNNDKTSKTVVIK